MSSDDLKITIEAEEPEIINELEDPEELAHHIYSMPLESVQEAFSKSDTGYHTPDAFMILLLEACNFSGDDRLPAYLLKCFLDSVGATVKPTDQLLILQAMTKRIEFISNNARKDVKEEILISLKKIK